MYVDWIRVTEYEDPVEEGGGGSTARAEATDLGAEPIPVNDYIANGDFSAEEKGALLGWEGKAVRASAEKILIFHSLHRRV